jgi:hypothetical protein
MKHLTGFINSQKLIYETYSGVDLNLKSRVQSNELKQFWVNQGKLD